MPLASASPLRSVAIGAGVGGKVSHRSAAKDGSATQAMKTARANWRMRLLRGPVSVGELFAFHALMQAVWTQRREARVTGNDIDTGNRRAHLRACQTRSSPSGIPRDRSMSLRRS